MFSAWPRLQPFHEPPFTVRVGLIGEAPQQGLPHHRAPEFVHLERELELLLSGQRRGLPA